LDVKVGLGAIIVSLIFKNFTIKVQQADGKK
jgi:hypothetical protein